MAARNMSLDRDELVLWVTIHEITHAVQFTGAPWLRAHLGGMLKELIDGLQVTLAGADSGEGANGRTTAPAPRAALRESVGGSATSPSCPISPSCAS